MLDKLNTRQNVKKILTEITSGQEKSVIICKKLVTLIESYKPQNILLFEPLKFEVDLNYIKPQILSSSKVYIADQVNFGFREYESKIIQTNFEIIDFLVAPGLAFDRNGYRLGRGGGWYDRLLSSVRPSITIGVCFHEQLMDQIPTEVHDNKFDIIITNETTVINK
jgi:5-formyltetrahydrofolate cyclo-ligase